MGAAMAESVASLVIVIGIIVINNGSNKNKQLLSLDLGVMGRCLAHFGFANGADGDEHVGESVG